MIVRSGSVALPDGDDCKKCDIRVRSGRIAEIAENIAAEVGEEIVDAEGLLVFPGAIDPHVHFDEPGFTHREDFLHGTSEAARGGVTTIIDMPCTSIPPVTTKEALDYKLAAIGPHAVIDYALFGGVSGHTAEESVARHMAELAEHVVGFKCYFVSGMETFTRIDHYRFALVMAEAERLGRPVLLHAEDHDYVNSATEALKKTHKDTFASWNDYVASRPAAAELSACASALALARGREDVLHIVHVGTPEAAVMATEGGATCETCAHYLAFSSDDFSRHGSSLKTAPPVKAPGNAARLWRLLADGRIAFCASDHAPAPEPEKNSGSVWTDYGGIPGTGTMFPYLYSEGFFARRLSLRRFLSVTGQAAARRYGLANRKGAIAVGLDADFALVDPDAETRIEGSNLFSKNTITPFNGMRLHGRVVRTMVRGITIFENSGRDSGRIVVEPGFGRLLRRED